MKPGFSHHPSAATLQAGLAMSPQEIFAWLEQANAFTDRALDPDTRKVWESFRAAAHPASAPSLPANR